jgi:hypothetical protein
VEYEGRSIVLNSTFFLLWLLASVYFWVKGDNKHTNLLTLRSTMVLGFLLPILHGLATEAWIWQTFETDNYSVFAFDVLLLMIGFGSLVALRIIIRKSNKSADLKQTPFQM